MHRRFMHGKIHRATVTEANLDYVGSITIDSRLLEAANILPYEEVQVVNITNGERLTTYTIPGRPGSGVICLNGAAARRAQAGDLVIIIGYSLLERSEWMTHRPTVVLVDEKNQITHLYQQEHALGLGFELPDTEANDVKLEPSKGSTVLVHSSIREADRRG